MPRYRQLDPELKAKWIAALRSGKYGQAEGALRDITFTGVGRADDRSEFTNNFCCLGVLCDVVDPNAWNAVQFHRGGKIHPLARIDDELLVNNGPVSRPAQLRLAQMNDGGESFDKIADWIENNL